MLVLSRRKGESIIIGDHIEISVVEVQGEIVKLGIKAPREVSIMRQELYEQVSEANREATQSITKLTQQMDRLKSLDMRKE